MDRQRVIWCGRPGRGTHAVDVGRPSDFKRLSTKDRLEERLVLTLGKPAHDTSRVGEAHFVRIDRGVLRLLRRGTLQLVSGGSQIPKVPSIEISLGLVVLECRKIR